MPLGFHVSKATVINGKKKTRPIPKALRDDLDWIKGFGIQNPCAQIFVAGPQNFTETLTDEDKVATRQYVNETGVQIVIHGVYPDHPWNRSQGSVHNIKQELRTAARIGATGVIVHLGAGAANEENVKYVLEEVSNLPDDIRNVVTLWLEIHTAKPGPFTYETPAKLRALFDRVEKCDTKGMKIGLCIDTAHLFSCGMALDTYDKAEEWLNGVTAVLPDIPIMMHLNDSASSLGSGIDRHEKLLFGKLWSAYHPETGHLPVENSGLVAILNWAESNDILTILERDPDGIISDLRLIQSLGYFQE